MNFLVIGHSVVDKIYEGKSFQIKPGGIFYTAVSLKSFLEKDDKLFLCTTVDENNYKKFSIVYDYLENDYLKFTDRIPVVKLMIKDSGEREEIYENINENIEIDYSNLNQFDGILINMITGFDISLKQFQILRKNYSGIVYFDVHTLSRGFDKNLKRNFRPIPDFNKWAECIDILQTNEYELVTLNSKRNEKEIVEELFNSRIKQVIVTKAERGSEFYSSSEGKINSIKGNALQTENISKVGCGDVFGAVYFYNYIKNKNAKDAFMLSNIAAGISTRYTQPDEYLKLKENVREQLDKN